MRLQLVGRHMEIPASVKAFAQEKVRRLERYFDGVTKAQLILSPDFVARPSARRGQREAPPSAPEAADGDARTSEEADPVDTPQEPRGRVRSGSEVSGHLTCAELVLAVRREHAPFVARARGEGYQAAIDMVVDKMERQVCKHKDKLRNRRQPKRGLAADT